jgi:hypothetical protein
MYLCATYDKYTSGAMALKGRIGDPVRAPFLLLGCKSGAVQPELQQWKRADRLRRTCHYLYQEPNLVLKFYRQSMFSTVVKGLYMCISRCVREGGVLVRI